MEGHAAVFADSQIFRVRFQTVRTYVQIAVIFTIVRRESFRLLNGFGFRRHGLSIRDDIFNFRFVILFTYLVSLLLFCHE